MELGFIGWIVVGLVAGFLAEKIMKRNDSLLMNLVIGVVGALLGGFIATNFLGFSAGGSWIMATVIALGGALLLLFVLGLFRRR
ncbi:MAG: GlsB/YeaQ/YmgE family stress response membrane protein [Caulobacterales bacterium]|nr:GlsB/YeaQ/YmgE family stress response membrane protein [Caulobacterales bacterium]